jgi:hypothetical protein
MSVKLNTRLTDNDRHQLSAKADSILEKRKVLAVEPWGTSPHRYYMKLLPTDLRAAIELINLKMEGKFSNALHTDSDASVVLCDAERSKVGNIQFMWKGQHPCVASSWNDAGALTISERHPAYHELLAFAKRCAELDRERSYGLKLVKHIANHCNTYGQIHRVWPDLLPTVGGEKVAAAEGQQRKSQLPVDLDTDMVMQQRDGVTNLLAQGSILPEREGYICWGQIK